MFARLLVASLVALGLSAAPAPAAVITSANYNGHTYHLLTASSWTTAEAEAATLGGNLVTVNDAAENAFLVSTFSTFGGQNRNLWIGFNDVATEGTFVWASGQPVTYTNWSTGEPNNSNGVEDYAYIIGPTGFGGAATRWNDVPNDPNNPAEPLYGVVEVAAPIPEPATLGLFGLVAVTATAVRRRTRA